MQSRERSKHLLFFAHKNESACGSRMRKIDVFNSGACQQTPELHKLHSHTQSRTMHICSKHFPECRMCSFPHECQRRLARRTADLFSDARSVSSPNTHPHSACHRRLACELHHCKCSHRATPLRPLQTRLEDEHIGPTSPNLGRHRCKRHFDYAVTIGVLHGCTRMRCASVAKNHKPICSKRQKDSNSICAAQVCGLIQLRYKRGHRTSGEKQPDLGTDVLGEVQAVEPSKATVASGRI